MRIVIAALVSFGRPYASRICSIFPLCMESKALVKSTNSNVARRFFARTPSRILRMVNICEVVDLFLRKPFWFFLRMLPILGSMQFRSRAILYRNTKVKVRSPDGDTEYFDIVAGVLQGETLAPYLFIICLDYVLRTSIDKIRQNGFEVTKKRSRRYPAKTITDADYIALLANTSNQAETLLHSLERAAAGIGLHVNAHKTEYMCYNQTGDISTLDGTSLKLVDKFTYLGSSVSSTEKYIDTRLTKAWTAIDRLSIKWKSDLTDKMKRSFFQAAVVSIPLYGCTTWTLTKRLKKLDGNYTRMSRAILNKSWW